MCNCTTNRIGNYEDQVIVLPPWNNRFLSIDRCILDEISLLWADGIVTTGCCCGHNQVDGFIGVEDEFIPLMKKLGYTVQPNPLDINREDSFNLKSV